MVVVTIVAVVSALVLPSMVQAMRERHAQEAAASVIDIARETRSRAMYRGVAHTLVITTSGSSLKFDSFEGTSSSCRLSRFGGGMLDAATRVYSLDLNTAAYTRDGIIAQVVQPTGVSYLQLCFTPLGVAYFTTSAISDGTAPSAVWSNDSTVIGGGGSFGIDVYQHNGVRRRVVIPLSGLPRLRT
jgi:type II secretory pathway pseudopilin PulG